MFRKILQSERQRDASRVTSSDQKSLLQQTRRAARVGSSLFEII